MRSLVWFRADLRVRDQRALHTACREADAGVVGLFLLSPRQWEEHGWAPCKVEFLLRNLRSLGESLARLNIPLLIAAAPRFSDAPRAVLRIARKAACTSVHFNREYEINESRRDDSVRLALRNAGIAVYTYDDLVVVPPGELRTGDDRFYTVFTPFRKRWAARVQEQDLARTLPMPRKQPALDISASDIPQRIAGFESGVPASLWPGGEEEAGRRLRSFVAQRLTSYKDDRDTPAEAGTSRLSAYLAAGVLSPRQCLRAAIDANDGRLDSGSPGAVQWISELAWRDFYKHVVVGFPRVVMGKAFKAPTDAIRWRDDDNAFDAWREGRTGVPIVDAAMRQLAHEGWMHNRLRMVSAMYLTKDLFIDWRRGERHFMRSLVDGDFASNNGGWQWSASTGTDAAPYFRIFNPVSQSRTHDPSGAFIRRYVPELTPLDDRSIHDPAPLDRERLGYPQPIADHAAARERVMKEFKKIAK